MLKEWLIERERERNMIRKETSFFSSIHQLTEKKEEEEFAMLNPYTRIKSIRNICSDRK